MNNNMKILKEQMDALKGSTSKLFSLIDSLEGKYIYESEASKKRIATLEEELKKRSGVDALEIKRSIEKEYLEKLKLVEGQIRLEALNDANAQKLRELATLKSQYEAKISELSNIKDDYYSQLIEARKELQDLTRIQEQKASNSGTIFGSPYGQGKTSSGGGIVNDSPKPRTIPEDISIEGQGSYNFIDSIKRRV